MPKTSPTRHKPPKPASFYQTPRHLEAMRRKIYLGRLSQANCRGSGETNFSWGNILDNLGSFGARFHPKFQRRLGGAQTSLMKLIAPVQLYLKAVTHRRDIYGAFPSFFSSACRGLGFSYFFNKFCCHFQVANRYLPCWSGVSMARVSSFLALYP